MAFQKLLLLVPTLLAIIFVKITCTEPLLLSEEYLSFQGHNDAVSQATAADAFFELELRQLKSKISSLENAFGIEETSIDEKTGELKEWDGSVVQLEKAIEEKSNVLASLQSTVRSLQDKESLGVKDRLGEVVNLRKGIEAQTKKKHDLQFRASAAEKKIEEMNLKLESENKTQSMSRRISVTLINSCVVLQAVACLSLHYSSKG